MAQETRLGRINQADAEIGDGGADRCRSRRDGVFNLFSYRH